MLYCNGAETCAPNAPGADAFGCLAGTPPCESGICDEFRDECPPAPSCALPVLRCRQDTDCGANGDYCDFSEPFCDHEHVDADEFGCAPREIPSEDYEACRASLDLCVTDFDCYGGYCAGFECNHEFPDDERGCRSLGISPEIFCSGTGSTPFCWPEFPGSDAGCYESEYLGCTAADCDGDAIPDGDDCDDDDIDRFPGNEEWCALAPEYEVGDALPNDNTVRLYLHSPAKDDDCDGETLGSAYPSGGGLGPDRDDDGYVDDRCCNTTDGVETCQQDCNDDDPAISPRAAEVCNGIDDNCNGEVDEGVIVPIYFDADGDGQGSAACGEAEVIGCGDEPGWVTNNHDCDDFNGAIVSGVGRCADAATLELCVQGEWVPNVCVGGTTCQTSVTGVGDCE